MNNGKRYLVFKAGMIIIILGLVSYLLFWILGKIDMGRGVIAGAGLAWLELNLTAVILRGLIQTTAKGIWGVILGIKSVSIFAILVGLILLIKVNAIGFLVGFLGLIPAVIVISLISNDKERN